MDEKSSDQINNDEDIEQISDEDIEQIVIDSDHENDEDIEQIPDEDIEQIPDEDIEQIVIDSDHENDEDIEQIPDEDIEQIVIDSDHEDEYSGDHPTTLPPEPWKSIGMYDAVAHAIKKEYLDEDYKKRKLEDKENKKNKKIKKDQSSENHDDKIKKQNTEASSSQDMLQIHEKSVDIVKGATALQPQPEISGINREKSPDPNLPSTSQSSKLQESENKVPLEERLERAERAARYQQNKDAEQPERERQAKIREQQEHAARAAALNSNEARIQFCLPDGSSTNHVFSADASLEEARRFVKDEIRPPFSNFSLCTTFPWRHFTQSNYSESLRDLQLAPSAVLLILPIHEKSVGIVKGATALRPQPEISGINKEKSPDPNLPSTSQSSNLQESENKVPLEERLERAKALLEVKKQLQENEDKEKEKNQELERRSAGKNLQKAQQQQKDNELKEWARNRSKEKEEERLAREKVKALIAQDRAERAARYQQNKDAEQAERERQAKIREEQECAARAAALDSNEARIQFRLPDGSSTNHVFSADASLEEERRFVKDKEKNQELERRSAGKNLQKAQQQQKDNELKEWARNRSKEKEEERLAREKVKALIAQDSAERAARYQQNKDAEQAERERQAKIREEQERAARAAALNSNEARIQFRLPDGSSTNHVFSADASLEEARRFVKDSHGQKTVILNMPQKLTLTVPAHIAQSDLQNIVMDKRPIVKLIRCDKYFTEMNRGPSIKLRKCDDNITQIPKNEFVWAKWGKKKYWPGITIYHGDLQLKPPKNHHTWILWFKAKKVNEIHKKNIEFFFPNFRKHHESLHNKEKIRNEAVNEALKVFAEVSNKVVNEEENLSWALAGFPGYKRENDQPLEKVLNEYKKACKKEKDSKVLNKYKGAYKKKKDSAKTVLTNTSVKKRSAKNNCDS